MTNYTFKDNSVEVLRRFDNAMQSSAEDIQQMLVEAAQEKILYGYSDRHGADGHTEIVDTGRLFDSIQAEVKRDSQNTFTVTVGSTDKTPYATFVHQGTRKLKGRPFISDAIAEKRQDIRRALENNLENA